MDFLTHIRMECVRLVMEGMQPSTVRDVLEQADDLVDYIKSGHISGSTGKASNGRASAH